MQTLDFRDSRPLYEQIVIQIQQKISTGILREGERLPSVRDMAGTLSINPNTIQRAYRELENSGWVVSVPGKGSFVSKKMDAESRQKAELLECFDNTALALRDLGVPPMELIARLTQLGGNHHA